MKTYEKPKLMALSLSGNDRLCGDCANGTTLWNRPDVAGIILEAAWVDPNANGVSGIDKGDFSNIFSGEDKCATPVDTYCKFTSAQHVAWS